MKNNKTILVEFYSGNEIKGVSIYENGLITEYYTPSSETYYKYNDKRMLIESEYIDTYSTYFDDYMTITDEYEYDNDGNLLKIISYDNIHNDAYKVYTEGGGYEYDEYRSYDIIELEDKDNYFSLPETKIDERFINDTSFIKYLPKAEIEVNYDSPKFIGLKEMVDEFLREKNGNETEEENDI